MTVFNGWIDLAEAELAHRVPDRGYAIACGVAGDLPHFWMPTAIALHEPSAAGQLSYEEIAKLDAWCNAHCRATWRRVFAGVYEFGDPSEAKAFDRQWCGP